MLCECDIRAAKLSLENDGFALPKYSDSTRVAYVLQGNGVVGIFLPKKEEKVLPLNKGDAIALLFGVITSWHNKEDTEFVVLFLGETKTSHKEAPLDVDINGGGIVILLNTKNLHLVGKGSGSVQVVGVDGKRVFETTVLEVFFNVDLDTEKLFRSKRTSDAIFFPSSK
ncbi:putative rmlC-like jelly roll protein [Rosa chinensis]|uniref:Putative rmlC-like jelly roll protein n=1 Tax=Rosa chinensis TaxID=74649 RepID=A0A2P6R404_ROSCH|nr:putative rmlC-like jelly roll protein [Rosa chinensis]